MSSWQSSNRSFVVRGEGASLVSSALYINAENGKDERQGLHFDYRGKAAQWTEFFVAENAPEWLKTEARDGNVAGFFNAIERFEDQALRHYWTSRGKPEAYEAVREKALVGFKEHYSLPVELNFEEAKAAVGTFIEQRYTDRGLSVSAAIHFEEGNPHFHVVGHTRDVSLPLDKTKRFSQFGKRTLGRIDIKENREALVGIYNRRLEQLGFSRRLDHRSYREQGVELKPTVHEGVVTRQLERKGIATEQAAKNAAIRSENRDRVLEQPALIVRKVSANKAVFTRQDLAREIAQHVEFEAEDYRVLEANVLADESLIALGQNVKGEDVYTTHDYLEAERRVVEVAGRMARAGNRVIDVERLEARLTAALEGGNFSDEQADAVRQLTGESSLSLLVGRAGTGKTTLLREVAESYQAAGYRVRGAGLAGVAAEALGNELGTDSRTFAAWEYQWGEYEKVAAEIETGVALGIVRSPREEARLDGLLRHHEAALPTDRDIFIIDEAGMAGTEDMDAILSRMEDAGAKVILVGDPDQLPPVNRGRPFELLCEKHEAARVETIRRQRADWQREASGEFSRLNIAGGLAAYDEQGLVQGSKDRDSLIENVSARYVDAVRSQGSASVLVMAPRNETVAALNTSIRASLQSQGLVETSDVKVGGVEVAVGDRLIFTRNDRTGRKVQVEGGNGGVYNGTLGRVDAVSVPSEADGESGAQVKITVALDDGRRATFDPRAYTSVQHGYAVTGHKAQGKTVERSIAVLERGVGPELAYVLGTRHRDHAEFHYSKEEFSDSAAVARSLGWQRGEGSAADYDLGEASDPERAARFGRVKDFVGLLEERTQLEARLREELYTPEAKEGGYYNQRFKHPQWASVERLDGRLEEAAETLVAEYGSHKGFLRQASLSLERLEVIAGYRERPETFYQRRAGATIREYSFLLANGRSLQQEMVKTHPGGRMRSHTDYSRYRDMVERRDELATEVAGQRNLYRPFLADSGITFKMLDAQAAAHVARIEKQRAIDTLPLAQRQGYAAIQTFKGLQKEYFQLYHDIKRDRPQVEDRAQHPDYLLMRQIGDAVSTAGARLYRARREIGNLLATEQVDMARLVQYKNDRNARDMIARYEGAIGKGDLAADKEALRIRTWLSGEKGRTNRAMGRALRDIGVDFNAMISAASREDNRRVEATLNPAEVTSRRGVQAFVAERNAVAGHWRAVREGGDGVLSDAVLRRHETTRDSLASKIMASGEKPDAFLTEFKVNRERLAQYGGQHDLRVLVTQYRLQGDIGNIPGRNRLASRLRVELHGERQRGGSRYVVRELKRQRVDPNQPYFHAAEQDRAERKDAYARIMTTLDLGNPQGRGILTSPDIVATQKATATPDMTMLQERYAEVAKAAGGLQKGSKAALRDELALLLRREGALSLSPSPTAAPLPVPAIHSLQGEVRRVLAYYEQGRAAGSLDMQSDAVDGLQFLVERNRSQRNIVLRQAKALGYSYDDLNGALKQIRTEAVNKATDDLSRKETETMYANEKSHSLALEGSDLEASMRADISRLKAEHAQRTLEAKQNDKLSMVDLIDIDLVRMWADRAERQLEAWKDGKLSTAALVEDNLARAQAEAEARGLKLDQDKSVTQKPPGRGVRF